MSQLPPSLYAQLQDVLTGLGDKSRIKSASALGGGCINHATRIETGQEFYFLKWNPDPLPELFCVEALGLHMLATTNTVKVPGVLAYAEKTTNCPAFLLLEWLEGHGNGDHAVLGQQLAALHSYRAPGDTSPFFGLDHHNYIGSTRQYNHPSPDWAAFFVEQRILPQAKICKENGYLTPERERRIHRLVDRIPDIVKGKTHQPSLIHGDLWGGNVINSPQGLALIDPAVSYSDREAEIAYTELFGGFSSRFYSAYQESWPLEDDYPERRDLYNLYHLFNHLNLFGKSYGTHVDSILRRYT